MCIQPKMLSLVKVSFNWGVELHVGGASGVIGCRKTYKAYYCLCSLLSSSEAQALLRRSDGQLVCRPSGVISVITNSGARWRLEWKEGLDSVERGYPMDFDCMTNVPKKLQLSLRAASIPKLPISCFQLFPLCIYLPFDFRRGALGSAIFTVRVVSLVSTQETSSDIAPLIRLLHYHDRD